MTQMRRNRPFAALRLNPGFDPKPAVRYSHSTEEFCSDPDNLRRETTLWGPDRPEYDRTGNTTPRGRK
jgi:hypothetical protein